MDTDKHLSNKQSHYCNASLAINQAGRTHKAAADSGASKHYFRFSDTNCLTDIKDSDGETSVTFPNGNVIHSSKEGYLKIPTLDQAGCRVQIFQDADLSEFSLLSIGQFCDVGCIAHYDKHGMWLTDAEDITLLEGTRDEDTGLYMVDLNTPTPNEGAQRVSRGVTSTHDTAGLQRVTHCAAPVIRSAPVAEKVAYWAASMGAPVHDTLLRAMRKGFIEFPGITTADVAKHPPDFTATPKGHMKMRRQGLQSTKSTTPPDDDDFFPTAKPTLGPGIPKSTEKIEYVCTKCIPLTQEHFSDMAGRFPYKSFTGAEYMLIMFCTDANYIHCETMTARTGAEYARAYQAGINFFKDRGITPQWERLDNETSRELTGVARKLDIKIQYLPPHNHRASKAERAIQTWKGHFISVLCMTHPDFPMGAWDHLVPQAEFTLNILRGSRVNPSKSAWAHLHGPVHLANTPIAPAGTKVVAYETPAQRASWSPHGVDAFYVGPALQHYRCYEVYVPKTKRTRTAETLSWHPHVVSMPAGSADELLHAAVVDLQSAMEAYGQTPANTTAARQPLEATRARLTESLRHMIDIFSDGNTPDTAPESQAPTKEKASPPEVDHQVQRDTKAQEEGEHTAIPADATVCERPLHDPTSPTPEDTTVTERLPSDSSPAPTPSPIVPDEPLPGGALVNAHPPKNEERKSERPKKPNPKYANAASSHSHNRLFTAMDMDAEGAKLRYDSALRSSEGAEWEAGANKEFDRLVIDTKTGVWIPISNVPQGRKISYYNPQLTRKRRPWGIEYRVRGTYGGDKGDYKGPTAAETADITTVKVLLNSVISDPQANWLTTDICDYYLGTPMDTPEFMRVPVKYIPEATMLKHQLAGLVHNNAVIMQLNKGIYGLKQAGRLAQQRLVAHLAEHGYEQTEHTPCLFKHITNSVTFTLVVDDFGVKYTSRADATHLLDTLERLYKIKTNWTGDAYIGFDIKLDRCPRTNVRRATMSMPRYILNALKRFKPTGGDPVYNPSDYRPGKHTALQKPTPQDTSAPATPEETLRIQQIVGVFLYYARAIDSTFLTAVSKVSSAQAKPTAKVLQDAERLVQYASTQPAAQLVYYASKMDLIVHGDASYLSETNARSRAAGVFYLGDRHNPDTLNAPILCLSTILDVVVSSATEAEYGAAYLNSKQVAPLRGLLGDMGYTQEPTIMYIDNKAAAGIANDSVTQRHSKAMDMRFHFVRDRVRQGQLCVTWAPGRKNLADYLTKAHPTKHFVRMRAFFVTTPPTDTEWTKVKKYAAQELNQNLQRRLTVQDLPDPRPPSSIKPP